VFSGEGKTRQATETENEKLRENRNSYFVPLERLSREAKSFATLQTSRYAIAAHFGEDAARPISALAEAHDDISTAAQYLIELAPADDDAMAIQSLRPFRATLWGPRPDAIDEKIGEAIVAIESTCKPVLSEKPPT
jgi:hypothetical protein